MEWLRRMLDKFRVRKPVPVTVPIKRAKMFVDEYLWDKIDQINKGR